MSNTGVLIYFKQYHSGDGNALQFPPNIQGFGLLLAGIQKDQPPPDQLAIDHLLASAAIYRFEIIMKALNLDEPAALELVEKIKVVLETKPVEESLIIKPKLTLV